jgi:hypothetical protein
MTRDDLKWSVGLVGAITVAIAALSDTVVHAFGIPAAALPYIKFGAFLVGVVSAYMKTSPLPGKAAWLLIVSLCGSMALTPACASTAKLSTHGKAAFYADEVVRDVALLRSAAIAANDQKILTDEDTAYVVKFDKAVAQTSKTVPEGVKPAVSGGLDALQRQLTPAAQKHLALYFSTIRTLLASF